MRKLLQKDGGKFDPSRCGGHKNSENAATFSELLGQEDKLSPAPTVFRHATRQPRLLVQHFHPPHTKPPSQSRQTAPISTTIPFSGGRNRTGRAKTSPIWGAAGKRYERGLTCAAGHGVPGVLLPSQPRHARHRREEARGKNRPRTHNFQAHIQASRTTRETLSPSTDKNTLPIPANRPNTCHNSHLGRAQPHREGENITKRGTPVKDVGIMTEGWGKV